MSNTVRDDQHGGVASLSEPGTTPSSGGDSGTRTTMDPNETVVKQLRDKLAEQGRENKGLSETLKALQETNTRLQSLVQRTSVAPIENGQDSGPDVSSFTSVILDAESTPEQTAEALQGFAKTIASYTGEKVRADLDARLTQDGYRSRANSVVREGERFFTEKGIPQLAAKDSDFYQFVVDEIKGGNAVMQAMWGAVDDSPSEVYGWVWDKYVASKGIKAPTAKTLTREDHEDAKLLDSPASTITAPRDALADVRAIEEKEDRNLTFREVAELMSKKGYYKEGR